MKTYSDITIHHPFSSSVQKEKYLLSYNGQYYEASHAIVELVEELQRYEEEKAAIEAYVRKKEGKYTPEQVREVIEKFIDPIFRAVPKKRSFLYEKELFSAGAIDRFSDTFRFLFHKAYMMVVLVGMLALDAWFFFTTSDLLLFNNKVNIYMVAGLLVFMLATNWGTLPLANTLACATGDRIRVVPELSRALYGRYGSVETEPGATVRGEPCRGLLPVVLADSPAGGFSHNGKRHPAVPDTYYESGVRDDAESFLQVRRLLDCFGLVGSA